MATVTCMAPHFHISKTCLWSLTEMKREGGGERERERGMGSGISGQIGLQLATAHNF